MRIARNLRLSVRALSAHPLRTALAVIATAVGVAGVIVLTAIGAGAREKILARIDRLGRNTLIVTTAKPDMRAARVRGPQPVTTLRVEDAAALVRGSPAIVRAAPVQDRDLTAKAGVYSSMATIIATTPDWLTVRQFRLAEGRFFTVQENGARARVAVLGADARTSLFDDSVNAVGRSIRIGSAHFLVVGVLAAKGVSIDGSATEDDRIIVPLETGLHRLFAVDEIKMIFVQAATASSVTSAERDAASILRARHDLPIGAPDDFLIQNQRILLATELATRTSFQRLLSGLGILSLAVGGVGILSIMLLAVRERRNEIGLRVAIGARHRDLVAQFLAESLLLAFAGGALGLALGTGTAALISYTTSWDAALSPAILLAATAASVITGVVFGVVPAWRAAGMDPIEALRAQ